MTFERGYQIFVRTAFIAGLGIIIIFLPFSKYILSIGMWTVTGAWILDRINLKKLQDFFRKNTLLKKILVAFPYLLFLMYVSIVRGFRLFIRNKPAVILSSLYVLHVIGLIFTVDFGYALKDLRTKIPMFILPLFFATSAPFGRKDFYRFMVIFILNLLVVTLVNTWNLVHFDFIDIRQISKHVSHIILGLMIALAVFVLGYFIFRKKRISVWEKVLASLPAAWFIIYMVMSRSFTGLGVTIITLLVLLVIYSFRSKRIWLKTSLLFSIVLMLGIGGYYLWTITRDFYRTDTIDLRNLERVTSRGNTYTHNIQNRQTENGHFIWIYIQWDELQEAWNQRSSIDFDSLDRKGQLISHTLVRYLTSKGLRKDADGVNQLEIKDIEAINKGIANAENLKWLSVRGRLYELLQGYEIYQSTGDPTGSSLMQRMEFWKASVGLIRDNWLTGVGTGDMNIAFSDQYEKMKTQLAPEQRWRSHNQFLSIFIAFGFLGIIWFFVTLVYPAWKKQGFRDYFFLVFFIIAMTSLLTEDTIESQAGVTFFYFFYTFFLFGRRDQDLL